MKIGFIGAGKVGCSLGRYLSAQNELIGYYSRTEASALEAAEITSSRAFPDVKGLIEACDTLFLTVPDGAIASTWEEIKSICSNSSLLQGKNICHCSGALPSSAFLGAIDVGCCTYSVHPLFAVSSKTTSSEELSKAFFAIEGSPEHLAEILGLITSMGNDAQVIKTQEKVRYHAAAAMASNHVVGLYRLACKELATCGFTQEGAERALAPLFLGNATHVANEGPVSALTGPAERGDTATIEKHLECLEGDTREVYRLLNKTLLDIAKEKHAAQ